MKKALVILFFLAGSLAIKAQIYMAKTCEISFFSAAPLENIHAVNKNSKPVLNTATGDIQIKVPISGFKFEKALMEEHFNENYMETEKFPNAVFKGKIQEKIDWTKDGEYKVTVIGNLEMHGVTKERTLDGVITIKGGQVMIASNFIVRVADHDIKVPSMYTQNIAETVAVKINATLEPYQKK
jgi:polyisoprenoid-binding protein YceI